VRDQRHPRLNALLNAYRKRHGCKLIQRKNETRQLVEALLANEAVGMTMDQGGKSGEPVKFFGITGGVIFLLGFVLGLRLLYFFFTQKGIVGHVPSLILGMLLMSVGVQVITFGFLADMVKK